MLHEESDEEEAAMVDRAFWDTLKKIGGHVVNAGKTVLGAAGKACKVMKGREEMRPGAILAAICSFICIICARADRSDCAKVAAMLPRDGGN